MAALLSSNDAKAFSDLKGQINDQKEDFSKKISEIESTIEAENNSLERIKKDLEDASKLESKIYMDYVHLLDKEDRDTKETREVLKQNIVHLEIILSIVLVIFTIFCFMMESQLSQANKKIHQLEASILSNSISIEDLWTENGYINDRITEDEIKAEMERQNMYLHIQQCILDIEELRIQIEEREEEEAVNMVSGILNAYMGVNYFEGHKETYYNLNMSVVVAYAKSYHEEMKDWEYEVREDGVKTFGGYVIVAANQVIHPYGSIVMTSLGEGIVLDTGSFADYSPHQIDIATAW